MKHIQFFDFPGKYLLLLGIFIVQNALLAQDATIVFQGIVKNASGAPVAGRASVVLSGMGSHPRLPPRLHRPWVASSGAARNAERIVAGKGQPGPDQQALGTPV